MVQKAGTVSFDLVVHYPKKFATQEAMFYCEDKHTANEMYWGPKMSIYSLLIARPIRIELCKCSKQFVSGARH